MDVRDFHKDFLEEIKATAATEGAGSNAAFVEVASAYLVNAEVLSDFTPAFYLGTGKNNRRIRVDGYVLDEFDMTFSLVIADYTGDENRDTLTRSVASGFFDRLMYFIEEVYGSKLHRAVEPSTPVADLIEMMRMYKDRIRKYRLILLTDGFMSNRISEIDAREFNNIPVECQIWDIDRIFRVCFQIWDVRILKLILRRTQVEKEFLVLKQAVRIQMIIRAICASYQVLHWQIFMIIMEVSCWKVMFVPFYQLK